jgi:simple sugar transport system permease protein
MSSSRPTSAAQQIGEGASGPAGGEAGTGAGGGQARSGEGQAGPGGGSRRLVRRGVAGLLRMRELSVLVVVILLAVYFALANSAVVSGDNLGNIANLTAPAAMLAAGEVLLLVCGEIDLSVGMTFALTPIVMMWFDARGVPMPLALLIGLVVAGVIGVFNGLATVLLRLPSFITTLGTLFLLHGVTLKVSSSFPVPAPTTGAFVAVFGGWQWSQLAWAIAVTVILQVVLTSTRWGVYTVATGGNMLGAAEAGVRVRMIKVRNFVVAAVIAGVAGVVEGIHVSHSFDPNAGGNELMFAAVASAVIGGTALLGGSGTVAGAFLGALLLGILQNGLTLLGYSATTFIVIEGVAILLAMTLNTWLSRLRVGVRAG